MLCAGSTNFPRGLYYTVEWKNIDNFMCTSDIFSMEKGKRGNNGSYSASRHVHRAVGRDRPILYSPDRPMNMKCHTCAAARTDQPNVICPSGCNVGALFILGVACIYAKKDFPTLFERSSQLNSLLQRQGQPQCVNPSEC